MLDRRLGSILLGAAGLAAYLGYGLLVPVEVEFTRAAPPPTPGFEMRPIVSTAHVALPIDLTRVTRRLEGALAHRLASGLDVPDPACIRRPAGPDCAAVKLDGAVSLGAPAEIALKGSTIRLRLPLKVEIGQGGERAAFEVAIGFGFAVRQGSSGLGVVRIDEPPADMVGSPHARVIRLLEARLRPLGLTVQDELRTVLAGLPVAAATQQAWNALSQPIELGAGSGLWLKSIPEVAGVGVIAETAGGGWQLRIPIATRMTVEAGQQPPAGPRRSVVHGQVNMGGEAIVRIATQMRLDALQDAVTRAFTKEGPIESRADRFGPPVRAEVKRALLYPSARQIAVELSLSATRYEGQSFHGKAHLVGRPVLDPAAGIVRLADITFPAAVARDAKAARTVPGAPRLAAEPFAARLAAVSRIDVAREVSEAVARTNNLLNRRIDDKLTLAARLGSASAVSLEIASSGAWLLTDLTGELVLAYDGAVEALAAPRIAEQPIEPPRAAASRAIPAPEIAAAAVVPSATAAATRQSGGDQVPAASALPTSATAAVVAAPADAPKADTAPAVAPSKASRRPVVVKPSTPRRPAPAQSVASMKRDWVPF